MAIFDPFLSAGSATHKPGLQWIETYFKANGGEVDAHWRTEANDTVEDNLNSDTDGDGLPGFFDANENGDGFYEAIDLNGDGIADIFQSFEDMAG